MLKRWLEKWNSKSDVIMSREDERMISRKLCDYRTMRGPSVRAGLAVSARLGMTEN
jgi:hypothetical protein